jgi:hypothetical protein
MSNVDLSPEVARLASTFQFTAEQLAANRAGRLAEGQLGPAIASAVIAGALALCALALGLGAMRRARGVLRAGGPVMALAGAATLIGVVALPALRDLVSGAVAVVDGVVDEVASAGKGRGAAVLVVGDLRILTRADPAAARLLVEGKGVHRVYHLRHSRRLLALEPSGRM